MLVSYCTRSINGQKRLTRFESLCISMKWRHQFSVGRNNRCVHTFLAIFLNSFIEIFPLSDCLRISSLSRRYLYKFSWRFIHLWAVGSSSIFIFFKMSLASGYFIWFYFTIFIIFSRTIDLLDSSASSSIFGWIFYCSFESYYSILSEAYFPPS